MLAGDLEVRFGPFVDRSRGDCRGNQRLLALILPLVESRRILGRLELGQLLAIGCLQGVDVEAGAAQPRLGLIDGNLVRHGINPE